MFLRMFGRHSYWNATENRWLGFCLFDTVLFSDVLLDLLVLSFWGRQLFFLVIDDGMLAMSGHMELGLNSCAVVENGAWCYLEIWSEF